MKKYSRFIMLLVVGILLAGCAKQTVDMKITDNGKMKVEIITAMASSMAAYSDQDKEALKKLGFKVEDYEDTTNDLKGIKYTKSYKLSKISKSKGNTVDISKIGQEDFDESQYFQVVKKGLFKTTYKATFVFTAEEEDSEDGMDYSEYADSFQISYSVTLPREAISNNASKVDGNTYTWDVKYGEKTEINYEFEVKNNALVYGIIGVIVIIIIGAIGVVILNKKKKNLINEQIPSIQ